MIQLHGYFVRYIIKYVIVSHDLNTRLNKWPCSDASPDDKFLVAKFEFGRSYEGDCHEVEVTPNLELLVTFGMSLEGVCHELYT
jgi:hypothetical protein